MDKAGVLEALGKTLIDSVGQGLFVLLCVMVGLWLTKNQSSKLRHNILFIGLIAMPLLSANSFVNHYNTEPEVIHKGGSFLAISFEALDRLIEGESPLSTTAVDGSDQVLPTSSMVWLSYAWIAGFLIYMVRTFGSFFYLNRLNRKANLITLTGLNNRLELIKIDLNIKRQVLLKSSERITSPLVYGVLKPVIIFPLGLIQGLTTEEVEAILLHELSHLKRNDFIINIVINVLKTIYFYHPAFWWMSAQLDNEREYASDEMVLNHRANALHLIKALSKTQEYQMSVPAIAFAGSSKNQLLKRVNRIMKKQQKPNWLGGLLAITLLASAFLLTSQQAKEKVNTDDVPMKEAIDSVVYTNGQPTLRIPIVDSTRVWTFPQNDSLTVEKALKEILAKNSKIVAEMTMDRKVTNISKNGKELSGKDYKIYKQAYEMLHSYADSYSESFKSSDSDKELIRRLKKQLDEVAAYTKQQKLNGKEYQEVLRDYELRMQDIKSKMAESGANPELEKVLNETLMAYRQKMKAYEAQLNAMEEQQEAEIRMKLLRQEKEALAKMQDQNTQSLKKQELQKLEMEMREKIMDIDQDMIRISATGKNIEPLIWVVSKTAKDTLVAETLQNISPENIEEISVYKGESARRLAPDMEENNGLILIEVDKPTFQKMKKTSKKLKRK